MKKIILLAITVAVLREVAKYFEITSWKDVQGLVPKLKAVVMN